MTLSTERIGYNIWKVCHQAFQRYPSLSLVCFDSSSVDTQCPFVMIFTISLYKQAICCILTFMQWRHSGWSNHGLFRGTVSRVDRLRKTVKKFWRCFVSWLDLDQTLIKCMLAKIPL